MGNITITLKKNTWTEAHLGAVTGAIMTALADNALSLVSLTTQGSTVLTVSAKARSGTDFTYAEFGALKTLIDSYCNANAIEVQLLQYQV